MTEQTLFVSVRLLDNRYHGSGTSPPSPFRLFQALVSAAFTGREVSADEVAALRWLENLPPPTILSLKAKLAKTTTYYVPRNGADAEAGDLAKAAKNRDPKLSKPWLCDAQTPLSYIWFFSGDVTSAETLINLCDRLYQLGRGIDMAFAFAERLDADNAKQIILGHPGPVYRPTPQGSANALACPKPHQSFDSLIFRHQGQLKRLRNDKFRKPPLPVFATTGYNCASSILLFDVLKNTAGGDYAVQPFTNAASFAKKVIDQAAERLKLHFSDKTDRYLLGRGANEQDKNLRIRVIPLPSIGFIHTPQGIRRLLVEVPPDCPLRLADVEWAFSGLHLGADISAGEILDEQAPILVKADDRKILLHYGIEAEQPTRVWRTVTPIALPLKPTHGVLTGIERVIKENEIQYAARQALRHSGLASKAQVVKIQREPFDGKGERATEFAFGNRFPAYRLYHLEIAFDEPLAGPIIIGDGRYFGLGLMQPLWDVNEDMYLMEISSTNRPRIEDRMELLQAVRRALMSLAREHLGSPGRLFSGHEANGSTARSGSHEHVFLAADDSDDDGFLDRVLVVAPWRLDCSCRSNHGTRLAFQQVASQLKTVRAGRLGVVKLRKSHEVSADDRLLSVASHWKSESSYQPTRFPKSIDQAPAEIEADIISECIRRGLPRPQAEAFSIYEGPRGGFRASIRLVFSVAISGPLLLGRDSHQGGGLFCAELEQI